MNQENQEKAWGGKGLDQEVWVMREIGLGGGLGGGMVGDQRAKTR